MLQPQRDLPRARPKGDLPHASQLDINRHPTLFQRVRSLWEICLHCKIDCMLGGPYLDGISRNSLGCFAREPHDPVYECNIPRDYKNQEHWRRGCDDHFTRDWCEIIHQPIMMLSDPYHDRNFEVKRLLVNNRSFVNALYNSKRVFK